MSNGTRPQVGTNTDQRAPGVDNPSPRVSVILTVYNRAEFLADAINSVLASDFEDFELVIVDDCSSDGSVEIARELAATDARIRFYRNDGNLGDYPNRRYAATLARGTYLKYVDSDDMIYPWGLGIFVRCMDRFPEAGFGLSAHSAPDRPHPLLFTPAAAYREEFHGRELFGRAPGSAIMRRDAYEQAGGFRGIRHAGDQDLWLRMGALFPVITLPPALVWDRTHDAQERAVGSVAARMKVRAELVRAALSSPDCPLDPGERQAALEAWRRKHMRTFWQLLRCRRFREAMAYRRSIAPLRQAGLEAGYRDD